MVVISIKGESTMKTATKKSTKSPAKKGKAPAKKKK